MSIEKLDLRRYQEFEDLYKKSMRITSKLIMEIKDPIIREYAENLLDQSIILLLKLEEDVKKLEGNEIKRVGSDVQS